MEMIIGIMLIPWLFLSLYIGAIAEEKKRSFIGWFLFAMIFSPLLVIFFLIAAGVNPKQMKEKSRMGWRGMTRKKSAAFVTGERAGQILRRLGKAQKPDPYAGG